MANLELLGLQLQIEAEGLDALREDHVLAGVLVFAEEGVNLGIRGRLAVVVGAVGPEQGQLAATVATRPRDGCDLEDFHSSLLSFYSLNISPQPTAI